LLRLLTAACGTSRPFVAKHQFGCYGRHSGRATSIGDATAAQHEIGCACPIRGRYAGELPIQTDRADEGGAGELVVIDVTLDRHGGNGRYWLEREHPAGLL
jgi:hypothetical protein